MPDVLGGSGENHAMFVTARDVDSAEFGMVQFYTCFVFRGRTLALGPNGSGPNPCDRV